MHQQFLDLLVAFKLPAIFIGTFFFGEVVVLAATFLAVLGLWSVWEVFLLAFLATLFWDFSWFIGGKFLFKTAFFQRFKEKRLIKYRPVIEKIREIDDNRPFFNLLLVKFAYGIRFFYILFLAQKKDNFLFFALIDIVGTLIWLFVLIFIGILVASGASMLLPIFNSFEYLIFVFVFFVFFLKMISILFRKKLKNKKEILIKK